MSKYEPGPLPEPFMELHKDFSPHVFNAWADQLRAYAAAEVAREVAAERQRIRDEFRKRHSERQMSHNFYACLAREMDDGLL